MVKLTWCAISSRHNAAQNRAVLEIRKWATEGDGESVCEGKNTMRCGGLTPKFVACSGCWSNVGDRRKDGFTTSSTICGERYCPRVLECETHYVGNIYEQRFCCIINSLTSPQMSSAASAAHPDVVLENISVTLDGYTYKHSWIAYLRNQPPAPVILVHPNYAGESSRLLFYPLK